MKRTESKLSEELEASVLLEITDALRDQEFRDKTYCARCGVKMLENVWTTVSRGRELCRLCRFLGMKQRNRPKGG